MRKTFILVIAIAIASLLISGCGLKNIIPDRASRPDFEDPLIEDLVAKYKKQETIKAINAIKTPLERNKCIDELLYITDVAFYNYSNALSTGKAMLDTTFDIGILTLGAVGAISTQSHIQTILAASSAGVAGTRASIDRNFFNENGMDAIVGVMRASRAEILAQIRLKMTLPYNDYTIKHALSDITEYNAAGSIPQALAAIRKTSGAKEEENDEIKKEFFKNLANSEKIAELRTEIVNLLTTKDKKEGESEQDKKNRIESRMNTAIQWFKTNHKMTLDKERITYGLISTPLTVKELEELKAELEKKK